MMKVSHGDDTRRTRANNDTTFKDFVTSVAELFALDAALCYLSWHDGEDHINIRNDADLAEALTSCGEVLRLHISTSHSANQRNQAAEPAKAVGKEIAIDKKAQKLA